MPFKDWQLRLQDIVESIDEILEWTANMTLEDLVLRYLVWFDRGDKLTKSLSGKRLN